MQLASTLQRSFDVFVTPSAFDHASLADVGITRALVVTTPTVDLHYGARLRAWLTATGVDFRYFLAPLTEQTKGMRAAENVAVEAMRFGLGRHDAIVAFGGGVCSDIVGVAASMIRRGVPHVRVPTTLVGQIDAAIGIKGGVNFNNHKNYLGCFHPPSAVVVDPTFLATLSTGHVLQGLAEIIKMAAIVDADLFATIEQHGAKLVESRFQQPPLVATAVIQRAISLMLHELQKNPFEDRTLQRLVDFGHTFSPALEAESGFTLAHGEAVAIDMALTSMLAEELGLMTQHECERLMTLLQQLGLPLCSPLLTPELCVAAVQQATAHRGGAVNLVVTPRIGVGAFVTKDDALCATTFKRCIKRLQGLVADKSPHTSSLAFA